MWGNLYAWEKIRELESELAAARPRYSKASGGAAESAGPAVRWPAAALSRLAGAMRRGDRTSTGSDPKAGQPALDALVEIRGGR